MTVTTEGLGITTRQRWLANSVELLSSMRFAISLLTVICIASVIGTVLKQREPLNNYVNQFGPFWSEVFGKLDLYAVYSAWWFLVILAFLVVSTSLCIARNTPKILTDFKTYKEGIREQSLKAFGHRAEATLTSDPQTAANDIGQALVSAGWKVKLQSRDTAAGQGWMVAAKAGAGWICRARSGAGGAAGTSDAGAADAVGCGGVHLHAWAYRAVGGWADRDGLADLPFGGGPGLRRSGASLP